MAQFNLYIPLLVAAEGGYQKLKNDNGNWTGGKIRIGNLVGTNHGISAPVYGMWINRTPTEADMRAITKGIALKIMKKWYWDKVKANLILNQSVADIIVDHAVNAGTGSAGKITQKTLNNSFGFNLVVDGAIGTKTIAAINKVNPSSLHNAIKTARHNFYLNLGGSFLSVWLTRLSTFVFTEKKKHSAYLHLLVL